jgi:protein gp37
MTSKSTIEWTEATWNPVTGCTKISAGCKNCYAERMTHRLKAMGQPNYQNGFEVSTHQRMLEAPLRIKKPHTIFVNSMSDLFHKDVPTEFIKEVFDVMRKASHHRFQVLTKRSGRLRRLNDVLPWPENVWVGVSVENQKCSNRVHDLLTINAAIKFLSIEPLLGPITDLELKGIDWIIVGGESGPKSRPMKEEWVLEIKRMCDRSDVPFFFKQWGGINKKKAGRELQGQTWDGMPNLVAVAS